MELLMKLLRSKREEGDQELRKQWGIEEKSWIKREPMYFTGRKRKIRRRKHPKLDLMQLLQSESLPSSFSHQLHLRKLIRMRRSIQPTLSPPMKRSLVVLHL